MPLPLFHIYGMLESMDNLTRGVKIILENRFDLINLFRQVEKHKVVQTFLKCVIPDCMFISKELYNNLQSSLTITYTVEFSLDHTVYCCPSHPGCNRQTPPCWEVWCILPSEHRVWSSSIARWRAWVCRKNVQRQHWPRWDICKTLY